MAFSYHLMLFIRARWLLVVAAAGGVVACQSLFRLELPYLPLYATIGIIGVYNILFWQYLRRNDFSEHRPITSRRGRRGWNQAQNIAWAQIVFDLLALFFLLHFTGGLENPFVIFFVMHVVVAGILLEPLSAMAVVAIVTVLLGALGVLEKIGILHHYHVPEVYGSFEPLQSWLFVIGIPAIISAVNVCLTVLTYFMMQEINRRRDRIIELSEEIEKKNAALLLLDSRRKQTMAIASHDLKSPIDAVSSYLNVLQDGYLGTLTDKQMDVIAKSQRRLRGLRNFISDVLDWQTIERGELQQVMEPTQLLDVLRDTVANYRDAAAQKNIALDMKVEEELPLVCASARRMAQVFDNLISNGVKYTPDGGTVTVDARVEDGSIVITVADTGIGMSEEEMQHLFEDFYRAPRVKATHEGTGLGLSVVQRIVQAHHGTVRAQSVVDQGTRFDVSIPICGLTLPPPSS